ncbi:MAG: B12-binding domain-containing radical SAM protein [Bdellovibrionales bacterium]|nr:B12-binding domain-containing radical SAM protein [Bdellovibrionales bacterium]
MTADATLITLIRTPTIIPKGLVGGYQGIPPLGLAYIAASLITHGHQVKCIDPLGEMLNHYTPFQDGLLYNGLTPHEVLELIHPSTTIVGISCMFSNEWIGTKILCSLIKERFPHIKIILGGEHATSEYDFILREVSEINFCVLGEGENKILDLIDALNGKKEVGECSGIAFLNANGEVVNTLNQKVNHYRIKNVDQIPWPAWHLIPLRNYLDLGKGWAIRGKRSMPIMASRGCPYQCSFCSSPQMWTTSWKPRAVDDLINEIKFYIKTYQVTHFDFYDLTAIVDKKWIMNFCSRLINEELNITWSLPSGTRSEAITEDVILLLKQSGLFKIVYAPESGSLRVLKNIQKRVQLDKMLLSMKNASKHGLVSKANMVMAFPDENFVDIFYDYIFIAKMAYIGLNDMSYFCFAPYPGSAFFNRLMEEKKIRRDGDYDSFLAKNVHNSLFDMTSYSNHIPSWTLPLITLSGTAFFYSLQFFFRPWRLLKTLWNILLKKPETMLEMALETIFQDVLLRRIFRINLKNKTYKSISS